MTIDLKDEFAQVNKFESPIEGKEALISDDKQDALYIVDNTLFIETKRKLQEPNISLNEHSIHLHNTEYEIDTTLMKSYTYNIDPTCLRIYKFHTKGFSGKKKLFRCIIPHFEHKKIFFLNSFQRDLLCSVNDPQDGYRLNGIHPNINEYPCFVYYQHNKLVIESHHRQSYKEFFKMCINLTSMIGFFTGYCQKDKGYIFEYDDFSQPFKGYTYDAGLLDTYNSQHCLISSNPSKYKRKDYTSSPQPLDSIWGLGVASREVFETMYNKINTNDEYNLAFFSLENILNGHKLSPLHNALLCVTLETMTALVSTENDKKMSWHASKSIKKAHRKGLLEFSKDFFEQNDIPEWEKSYIKNRLENIDAPTNRDKLAKPFEILDISLTQKEIDALNDRNNFLHGKHGYGLNDSMTFLSDFYTFNYLIQALLLKYVGFSGKIINKNKDFGDKEIYKQL